MPDDPFDTQPHDDKNNNAGGDRPLQRELLWALLGVQNQLIDRKRLPAILAEWKTDKSRPLGKLLTEHGSIVKTSARSKSIKSHSNCTAILTSMESSA